MTDLRNLTCEAEGGVRANLARLVYLQRNLYSRADDEYMTLKQLSYLTTN